MHHRQPYRSTIDSIVDAPSTTLYKVVIQCCITTLYNVASSVNTKWLITEEQK